MNSPQLLRYLRTWQATHLMIHGALTPAEQSLFNELSEFLLNCARAEGFTGAGYQEPIYADEDGKDLTTPPGNWP